MGPVTTRRRETLKLTRLGIYSNSTIAGLSSTSSYLTVFEEVSKANVQLNVAERLWAVCAPNPDFGFLREQPS